MTNERQIEKYLIDQIEKLGGKCLKFLGTITGVPDRIILLPDGSVWFVEVKRPDGKLSPRQEVVIKEFIKLKQNVIVLKSKEDICNFIHTITKSTR